jgi:hypothetical protein
MCIVIIIVLFIHAIGQLKNVVGYHRNCNIEEAVNSKESFIVREKPQGHIPKCVQFTSLQDSAGSPIAAVNGILQYRAREVHFFLYFP